MSSPRVTVIMPCYNRSHFVGECLRTVREQTFKDFEAYVIDDASDDREETHRIVESLGDDRLRYVCLGSHGGPAKARNTVLQRCSGEYVSFIDSDDLWLPRKLEDQILILDSNPDAAMVYSDEYTMSNEGQIFDVPEWARRKRRLPSGLIASDFLLDSFIGTMTVTIRTAVLREMGGFDEELIYNEDDDLWFRVMLKYPVICSDYPAGIRRLHRGNMSLNRNRMVLSQMRCINKYLNLNPQFMKINVAVIAKRLRKVFMDHIFLMLRRHSTPTIEVVSLYLRTARRLKRLK